MVYLAIPKDKYQPYVPHIMVQCIIRLSLATTIKDNQIVWVALRDLDTNKIIYNDPRMTLELNRSLQRTLDKMPYEPSKKEVNKIVNSLLMRAVADIAKYLEEHQER